MRRRILSPILVVFAALAAMGATLAERYADTIEVFRGAVDERFFEESYGYAVFPNIGKGGVGIGGAHGKGQVYVDGKHVGYTSMTQLSVGWQLGAQAYSQIIFFENEGAYKAFTSGNFEFGAQAAAVAITAAASASTSTTGNSAGASGGRHDAATVGEYHRGMAVFTVAKGGLMYEASISGQKFRYSDK